MNEILIQVMTLLTLMSASSLVCSWILLGRLKRQEELTKKVVQRIYDIEDHVYKGYGDDKRGS